MRNKVVRVKIVCAHKIPISFEFVFFSLSFAIAIAVRCYKTRPAGKLSIFASVHLRRAKIYGERN